MNRLYRLLGATGLVLSIALNAAAEEDYVAKHWDLLPVKTAEGAALPTGSSVWGQWHFWNGQWWAQHLLQPEAEGPSWNPPKGFDKSKWMQYRGAWLRTKRQIPKDWQGGRVRLALDGIRGCSVKLFVNGKEVATLKPPSAECDLTQALVYGGANEFLMLLDGGKSGAFKLDKSPPKLVRRRPFRSRTFSRIPPGGRRSSPSRRRSSSRRRARPSYVRMSSTETARR